MQQIAEQLLAAGKIYAIINIWKFIKHIVELYAGPNRNTEIDKEVIKQP